MTGNPTEPIYRPGGRGRAVRDLRAACAHGRAMARDGEGGPFIEWELVDAIFPSANPRGGGPWWNVPPDLRPVPGDEAGLLR